MRTLAKGKDAVLAHLEHAAMGRTGKPGAYRVFSGDSGNTEVVIIAGHTFSGTQPLSSIAFPSDIAELQIENRIVIDVEET
jgi:hypothetical protein